MSSTSEVIVIGGGVIGLAIALELQQRGAAVTVLSRDYPQAAGHAAAGMLAPHAEQLTGAMLDLCLRSRWLYPEWSHKLAELTGIETGYLPCGILAPVFEQPKRYTPNSAQAIWCDRPSLDFYQPGLGETVTGAWWHPEDGQVDNRCLMAALVQATQLLGVNRIEGATVEQIQTQNGQVRSLLTSQGEFSAQTYILATGSWGRELLPIPIHPVKGQMLALRMPLKPHQPQPLQQVLFAPGTYLVPRRDGRLIVGATAEQVDWTPHNTPQGIQSLLAKAIALFPALADWAIEDLWWGFRPGTPDELPILGQSLWDNLILATGHYRNGILLAPVTAQLIADLVCDRRLDPILDTFCCDRFLSPSSHETAPLTAMNVSVYPSPVSFDPSLETIDAITPEIAPEAGNDDLIIAGKRFKSRLMTGTGKYPSINAMQQSVIASGCEIVTVAVRRVQTKAPGHEGLAEALDWEKIWMLPNTAGCQTAEEAIRVARLGREMAKLLGQEDNNFVKLEVIPDSKYLLPDPIGTLEAAEQLVKEGFAVLPYINADPLLAKRLEEAGCVTVMPLGSPIGSGQGIRNAANIAIIIEQAQVPVVVDAGIGAPSEAAQAMEMGADCLLINSAIALARDPVAMALAIGLATQAGRLAYHAGRMPIKVYAQASSPLTGTI
jgi:thiazole synthase